ncbi:cytochrome b/b6 domain-containing protein [Rheinheimera salexigens]|uniref:Cytochrome B n=1 Tax=Rheinheimera salexigens TaxID=1628148 RepID=A0A1E7Q5D0_9GAMM|nr:cytochrome b/b6 domain-containing protein [Rheinheimera salexigens]OEY69248.1 cytochrome B [Rheinheimera salexigens]
MSQSKASISKTSIKTAGKIQVWDVAVRVFHWSQVLLIAGLWYTGEEGYTAEHQLLAFTLLALIISRIVWGIVGSKNAQFARFAASPMQALRYLFKPTPKVGHNPASFYMIMLLIILMLVQLITGMATFDNSYLSDGPLVKYLSADMVDLASTIHSININILLAAIAVHVIAAVWHSVAVHNVIAVMITGKDQADVKSIGDKASNKPATGFRHSGWFFLLLALLLVALYFWQGQRLMAYL